VTAITRGLLPLLARSTLRTMKFLHLNFIPRSADAGLLILRLWFGGSLLLLHGWGKLANFSSMSSQFPDFFGIGKGPTLALSLFAELVCAGLVALGLFTRAAALVAMINMGVAFWLAHGHRLTGQGNGELPFIYLGAFLTIFVAGGGKFSVDAKIGAKG
jgi:putative oxidoreductase